MVINSRYPAPTWSKVIGNKFTDKSSDDINSRCQINLVRDAVLTQSPNFVNLGLSSVHPLDDLGPYSYPLPELERRRMAPTGSCPAIVLVKLQRIEGSVRGQRKTVILKLILKLGGKINILGAKIIL